MMRYPSIFIFIAVWTFLGDYSPTFSSTEDAAIGFLTLERGTTSSRVLISIAEQPVNAVDIFITGAGVGCDLMPTFRESLPLIFVEEKSKIGNDFSLRIEAASLKAYKNTRISLVEIMCPQKDFFSVKAEGALYVANGYGSNISISLP